MSLFCCILFLQGRATFLLSFGDVIMLIASFHNNDQLTESVQSIASGKAVIWPVQIVKVYSDCYLTNTKYMYW